VHATLLEGTRQKLGALMTWGWDYASKKRPTALADRPDAYAIDWDDEESDPGPSDPSPSPNDALTSSRPQATEVPRGAAVTSAELQALVDVARAHAQAEQAADIEATLGTLDDDPVYELQPMGRVLRGAVRARRYYEHFFANFMPLAAGFELRNEWVTDEGLGQEYTIWLRLPDGGRERHDVIGILLFGGGKLAGERVYASDRLLQLMFGPLLEEVEPIEA